jgi:glutaredoxin-like YruB-family protein
MKTIEVNSYQDLQQRIGSEKRSYLLIYKKGSELSDTALLNIEKAAADISDIGIFTADVNRVKDIHPAYSITSAPSLVEFSGGDLKNTYKGAHDQRYYKALFENAVYVARAAKAGKTAKQVTVYTTPTCSWCGTLKSYLNKNKIRFSEIDVSRDEGAAQEMVRRSGQQGVPQTLISGEMVIGFDKAKINRLLEIEG